MEVEEGGTFRASATLAADGSWVDCDARAYTYSQFVPHVDVPLFLTAGGRHVIDKINGEFGICSLL
jgi:hypothetical protein